jgi:Helix-turn-helix domain
MTKHLLNATDVAAYMGVSNYIARELMNSGEFRVSVIGKRKYVRLADLDAYIGGEE